MKDKSQIAGWIGVAIVMTLYTLAVNGVLTATSATYLIANIIGGSLITVSCVTRKAWPAAVLNVLFVTVSAIALALG
jgi:hypothetical protein